MRLVEIASPIPTRSFAKLFHVGSLNIADKRRGSYEGAGLSVSLHPEEWMQIAKIGGPIWQCTRPGNRFIDFYRLRKPHKAMIAAWAIEHQWATRTSLWRVSYYDEEMEDERYFTFADPQEAQDEAEDYEDAKVTEVPGGGLMGTPALYQRMMQDRQDPDVDDLVTIVYAEDAMKVDGVWFNERLDPDNLSAPRGVIVPSMVTHWKFSI